MGIFGALAGGARRRRLTWPQNNVASAPDALVLTGAISRRSSSTGRSSSGLREFFRGDTIEELKAYLDLASLSDNDLRLLLDEMEKGETVISRSDAGEPLRIVSVAKPIIFDASAGEILVEMFHTKIPMTEECRLKATGMSEKFNPLRENSRVACGRALREEVDMSSANEKMFAKRCLRLVERQHSDKFVGLRCEYHLYLHMLKPEYLAAVRGHVPGSEQLTKVDERESANPKSIWWTWVAPGPSDEDIHAHILRLAQCAGLSVTLDELAKARKFGNAAAAIRKQLQLVNSYLDALMLTPRK
ncbi:Hypothetical Protein FCC1311_095012 [Hondaea fermentalgiana]|uniref:Uncharacterized protein n=1 Tax=Hondaea fermentalgiana TaxID=2315210 RepID=A0A2R5GQX2_9STRA|nr:Hypothetical Protein FCC1311_095012 [Hondaea fermentalgiana]|eukprot:GBG33277.1 Hypothetical Protein FCC1311_095012 [Hondaea fermentalgiana]